MDLVAAQRVDRVSKTGSWLTTMPSALNGTMLTSEEFCDNLALRFGLTPAGLPTKCRCGA